MLKTKLLQIRISVTEKKELEKVSKLNGETVSNFVRKLISKATSEIKEK